MSRRRDILRMLDEDELEEFGMMQVIFLSSCRERRSGWQYERLWNKLLENYAIKANFIQDFA